MDQKIFIAGLQSHVSFDDISKIPGIKILKTHKSKVGGMNHIECTIDEKIFDKRDLFTYCEAVDDLTLELAADNADNTSAVVDAVIVEPEVIVGFLNYGINQKEFNNSLRGHGISYGDFEVIGWWKAEYPDEITEVHIKVYDVKKEILDKIFPIGWKSKKEYRMRMA
jgi:hypothetical protein